MYRVYLAVQQLDNVRMREGTVHLHLVFSDLSDLYSRVCTILTATMSLFLRLRANLTCPYDPNPIVTWLLS